MRIQIARARGADGRLDPLAHLRRGLVRERDREDLVRLDAELAEQVGDAVGEHARLPGAGAGDDEQRPLGGRSPPRAGPRSGRRGRSRLRSWAASFQPQASGGPGGHALSREPGCDAQAELSGRMAVQSTHGNRAERAREVVRRGPRRPRDRRLDRARRDRRAARAERRRKVDDDRHAARPARARQRLRVAVFGAPPREAVDAGAVGAMLQTGALIRDLTVRELVAMMASLYPAPLAVDEVLELTGIDRDRRPADAEALGRADPARALRRRARQQPRAARPRRADRRDGRRGPARASGLTMRDVRRPRQDGPLRHPLPRGGRRLRRPGRADGERLDRRRRPAERDQGDGRHAHDPRDAARRPARGSSSALPGVTRAERRGESVVLALHRLRRGDPRAPRRPSRRRATSRSAAPGSRRPSCS